MKQITQKDLINLIEEKQENARIAYSQTFNMKEGDEAREQAQTNKAYIDAYQDLIYYINSVEIVPEETIVTTIPKTKKDEEAQEFIKQLAKTWKKTPITPYIEPKIEPIRNDRFREFERGNKYNGCKINIDAKEVSNIIIETTNSSYSTIEIDVCGKNVLKQGYAPNGIEVYNELVEWWKYWKQN